MIATGAAHSWDKSISRHDPPPPPKKKKKKKKSPPPPDNRAEQIKRHKQIRKQQHTEKQE